MMANRVIVEVVRKTGGTYTHTRKFNVPRTLVDVESELWRKIGRRPAVSLLAYGTARVVFQEGRRVTDTLDSLEALVRLAVEGGGE